jgi:hypothetical protein
LAVGATRHRIADLRQDHLQVELALHGFRQAGELLQRDKRPGPGQLGLPQYLLGVGVGIGQHHRAADLERPVVGDQHLRHVRQHHHDPVARLHAQAVQGVGELVGAAVKLLIGEPGSVNQVAVWWRIQSAVVSKKRCSGWRAAGSGRDVGVVGLSRGWSEP